MKKITYTINVLILFGAVSLGLISCQDYLDKSPEAGLTQDEIFKSFDKFQGFMEDAYDCMVDPANTWSINIFNFGDDLLKATSKNYLFFSKLI